MSLLVSVRLSERGRILSKYLIWRKFLCVIISVLTSPEGRGQGDKWRVSTMQSPRCHGGELSLLSLLSLVTGVNKTRLSELIAHQSTGHGPAPKTAQHHYVKWVTIYLQLEGKLLKSRDISKIIYYLHLSKSMCRVECSPIISI